jgi:hypothetical protein
VQQQQHVLLRAPGEWCSGGDSLRRPSAAPFTPAHRAASQCARRKFIRKRSHRHLSHPPPQANGYGFYKSDTKRFAFRNPLFQRGREDLLAQIQRRKAVKRRGRADLAAESAAAADDNDEEEAEEGEEGAAGADGHHREQPARGGSGSDQASEEEELRRAGGGRENHTPPQSVAGGPAKTQPQPHRGAPAVTFPEPNAHLSSLMPALHTPPASAAAAASVAVAAAAAEIRVLRQSLVSALAAMKDVVSAVSDPSLWPDGSAAVLAHLSVTNFLRAQAAAFPGAQPALAAMDAALAGTPGGTSAVVGSKPAVDAALNRLMREAVLVAPGGAPAVRGLPQAPDSTSLPPDAPGGGRGGSWSATAALASGRPVQATRLGDADHDGPSPYYASTGEETASVASFTAPSQRSGSTGSHSHSHSQAATGPAGGAARVSRRRMEHTAPAHQWPSADGRQLSTGELLASLPSAAAAHNYHGDDHHRFGVGVGAFGGGGGAPNLAGMVLPGVDGYDYEYSDAAGGGGHGLAAAAAGAAPADGCPPPGVGSHDYLPAPPDATGLDPAALAAAMLDA